MSDIFINGMLQLKKLLRRERQKKLLVLALVLLISLGLLSWGWMVRQPVGGLLIMLGMGAAVIGLKFGAAIFRNWPVEAQPLYRVLHQQPDKVVWVFRIQHQLSPFGVNLSADTTLCLKLSDRDELQLRGREQEIQTVLAALVDMLPQATFGYSKERSQWYDIDPYLLRQEEG